MKPSDKLRILLGLEKAEHRVSEANDELSVAKSQLRDLIIGTVDLDPVTDDIDKLRAQVAMAIMLVIQADKIVRATEAIVSKAHDAVEIARQMHVTARSKDDD